MLSFDSNLHGLEDTAGLLARLMFHTLSLSGRRDLRTDGKEVNETNEPIIKQSQIEHGNVIEFRMCDMP